MLVLALLAATPMPSDDAILQQAARCGLAPSQLVWNVDAAGKRQLDLDGELPTPSASSVNCMVKWAKQNGVSVGLTSQPVKPQPLTRPRKVVAAGVYLCTVAQKAGLARIHLEGAGGPSGFIEDKVPTRFKMRITPVPKRPKRFRLVEIAYDGADRDPYEWEDENSVLHSTYLGDGSRFHAVDSEAFFVMARSPDEVGDFEFYHAGFEHPGGEETNLSVRWGKCRKVG